MKTSSAHKMCSSCSYNINATHSCSHRWALTLSLAYCTHLYSIMLLLLLSHCVTPRNVIWHFHSYAQGNHTVLIYGSPLVEQATTCYHSRGISLYPQESIQKNPVFHGISSSNTFSILQCTWPDRLALINQQTLTAVALFVPCSACQFLPNG